MQSARAAISRSAGLTNPRQFLVTSRAVTHTESAKIKAGRSCARLRSTLPLTTSPCQHLYTAATNSMPRTAETSSFKFNHTMIRVKDPKKSLQFYTEVNLHRHLLLCRTASSQYRQVLGMDLLSELKQSSFTLYFLGYDHSDGKDTAEEKSATRFDREGTVLTPHSHLLNYLIAVVGVLELTWNHGTESDPSFAGYASGNTEPGRGFGHIAITVDDVPGACERFEQLGVPFKKRPHEGTMKNIAFILDPDGYWVEIVPSGFRG